MADCGWLTPEEARAFEGIPPPKGRAGDLSSVHRRAFNGTMAGAFLAGFVPGALVNHATLTIDVAPEFEPAVSAFVEAVQGLLQVGPGLVGSIDAVANACGDGEWLFAFRTVEGGLHLEPSQRLLELVAASGTGEFERLLVKKHGVPS